VGILLAVLTIGLQRRITIIVAGKGQKRMDQTENSNNKNSDQENEAALREFFWVSLYVGCAVVFFGLVVGTLVIAGNWLDRRISDPVQFVTVNLLNVLIFVAIVAQVLIYRKQWKIMERQWSETKKQSETALKQFETTDRPWLSFHVAPSKSLTFTDNGLEMQFKVAAKNIGRSVAINATINAKPIIPQLGAGYDVFGEVKREQERVCSNVDSKFLSYIIFPGDDYTIYQGACLSQEQVERGRLLETPIFAIYLVGCVDYQFVGHERHHQTRFIYEVRSGIGLNIGKDVPLPELALRKHFFGGDYAD